MKNVWCKIVEVDDEQVLFWIDWNCDVDGDMALHQQCAFDGLQFDAKIVITPKPGLSDEDIDRLQQETLDKCNEDSAREVLKYLRGLTAKAEEAGTA